MRIFTFPNAETADITPAQHAALCRASDRWNLPNTVEVSPMLGGDGVVVVNVGTMWLAVETDGYTHS